MYIIIYMNIIGVCVHNNVLTHGFNTICTSTLATYVQCTSLRVKLTRRSSCGWSSSKQA